jgi:hypothetical protein
MPATSPDWASLLPALLDFERSPGRYPVVLREPRPLFDHARAVLQLAGGRSVEGLADLEQDPARADALRQAARFFVRTVLLRPGVDHYTLLGLVPGCDAAELREHYRLMIRLTHPDFAAGRDEAWPADAATRINRANDVLSSPGQRADYNATLAPAMPAAPAAASPAPQRPVALRPGVTPRRLKKETRPADARPWHERVPSGLKIALVSLGALGAAVALLLNNTTGDSGSLTVRKIPPVRLPVPAPAPALETATAADLAMAQAPGAEITVAAAGGLDDAAALAPAGAPVPVSASAPAVATLAAAEPVPAPPPAPPRRSRDRPAPAAAPAPPPLAVETVARDSNDFSQVVDTQLHARAMNAVAVSASAPVAAPASAPVPASAPALVTMALAPPPAVAEAPAQAAAAETAPAPQAPTLAQVQPALSGLVTSLPSGRGENLVQWIHSGFRTHPDTGRFVGQFNQLLAGQRVTQLGNVRFRSRAQGAQLVVDGVIELHTLDTNNEAHVRDLHLRAFFQPQDGQPVLTQLVAGKLQ